MSVTLNRDAFLASEPEIDVTQFRKVALDLPYADQSPNQILDVWYPEDGEGPYPLVILFHGGAFAAGHKRSFYITSMAKPISQGYAVATVEYRLYTEAKWPAQLIDGKSAIRYLRANAEQLNLDPDRFALWGNSAGGNVTQLLAVSGDQPELDDLTVGVPASAKIQAAIAWYTTSELMSAEQFGTDIAEKRNASGAGKGMMPNDGQNASMFGDLLGYLPLLYPERTMKASPISFVKEDCPPHAAPARHQRHGH
ncbi:MAG: alpha/beta hydrolase [Clostridiales bacterium]|nr:alpha/beta hydrolase [Clostridiales bacterium]